MDKKKLETFKKRLETRQQELRRTVNRTQADGRSRRRRYRAGHRRPRRQFLHQGIPVQPEQQRSPAAADGGQALSPAFAKAASANASTAAKRSTPSASKPCRGRATASNARKSWSRDCWKKLRGRELRCKCRRRREIGGVCFLPGTADPPCAARLVRTAKVWLYSLRGASGAFA